MGGRNVPTVSSSSSSSSSFFSHFCSSALRTKPSNSPYDVFSNRINSGEGLIRRLGVIDLILIGVGASIGAGIFVITGTVARDTGPGVTISFILAGVSCILNALCYAELATRFPPVVGGAYLYAYTAFNELTAFLVFAQLTLDYHIGIASIARSLAGYTVSFLEIFPIFKDNISNWFGNGQEFFGGVVSVNLLAPVFVAILTFILCWGVGEFCAINSIMSSLKVIIVVFVIFVGAFEVDVSNWSPFTPNGFHAVLTGATVVFFAYVGFDAVANSAEESKSPRRDLPIGIIGSLLICIALYIGVCLVITGMVPYYLLGEDAPLAEAFTSKGLNFVSLMISIGAIAGLTTTLLVGLYVQSRMYLGLGRDGLLPSIFSKVHPKYHTPITSQLWVSFVAGLLAGLFNVHSLARILSVGTLTGYSVVAAGVVTLRWEDKTASPASSSTWREGVICIMVVACSGFGAGLFYRFGSLWVSMVAAVFALLASIALHLRHVYGDVLGFPCPGVPFVPALCIFFNMFLSAQLHQEAWVRFVVLSVITVIFYACYGQYHATPSLEGSEIYFPVPG
ncbi:cationic amino acid transporter 9, chloroplastic-like [Cucurbita moschata]|uniref:Cationic amino acid transporter 9, chloroplastic-like n=1 Tax=Cucurbita moschata TaxID=3662 RepID=A0A6J1H3F8_CUCMO|nr:cationic amino acid transporter 9, chloroplastic-like [Cucurbita moschata]